jgi:hypothetical protein
MGLATSTKNFILGNRLMLFEAFLVFWMLEFLVILAVIAYWYHEPKPLKKKIYDPWNFWEGVK